MNASQSLKQSFSRSITSLKSRKGLPYVMVIVLALAAFEAFNFSTTDFALSDLLGDLRFAGVRWATLLSIAFCAIDFSGVAWLFAPQMEKKEPRSTWYMFGAWILAAIMNAILTWWGVVMAMQTHAVLSAGIVDASFVSKTVPIFIALLVWVIRILLIGSLSRQGDRLLNEPPIEDSGTLSRREFRQAQSRAAHPATAQRSVPAGFSRSNATRSAAKSRANRPEATYVPVDEAAFRTLKASDARQRRI